MCVCVNVQAAMLGPLLKVRLSHPGKIISPFTSEMASTAAQTSRLGSPKAKREVIRKCVFSMSSCLLFCVWCLSLSAKFFVMTSHTESFFPRCRLVFTNYMLVFLIHLQLQTTHLRAP